MKVGEGFMMSFGLGVSPFDIFVRKIPYVIPISIKASEMLGAILFSKENPFLRAMGVVRLRIHMFLGGPLGPSMVGLVCRNCFFVSLV